MSAPLFPNRSAFDRPVIGMLHLPPLPGSPGFAGDTAALRDALLRDAEALVAGGVHALMMENFGDTPFTARRVPRYVVSWMTVLAGEVRRRFDLPLGINVLRNDGRSALAVAAAVGAAFIRVNVLCGARVTDQGIIEGIAYELLRERKWLGAEAIRIFADVNVKHSAPLGPPRPVAEEVADLVHRGGADALFVTGGATGRPTPPDDVRQVKDAADGTPVFVGSGVTSANVAQFAGLADGFIIGTSFKQGGISTAPVDRARVAALMAKLG
ncbi:MAG: BtpA/SgcQ family protein [Phycisphaerae bacterium]|jgi:membrane complex biogenesis BtpA family protein